MTAFADLLKQAIAASDIACLRIMGDDTDRVTTVAKALLPLAQEQGVAVLLDTADLAVKLRADGVHLADAGRYREARRLIGTDGIVGIGCPLERHAAMEAADDGADYVQFFLTDNNAEDALELVEWWSEVMTVPCVIGGVLSPSRAAQFVAAGVDFLAPDHGIWSEQDPVAAIASLLPA